MEHWRDRNTLDFVSTIEHSLLSIQLHGESFLVSNAWIGSHLNQLTEQVYCMADGHYCVI
jgi:hypothetical protein